MAVREILVVEETSAANHFPGPPPQRRYCAHALEIYSAQMISITVCDHLSMSDESGGP